MGLFDFIKKKPQIRYLDDSGRPLTVVRAGGGGGIDFGEQTRSPERMATFWRYYEGDGSIWAAVNSIAFNTVMVGYDIESDNVKARNLIDEWCKKANLEEHLLNSVIYALVMGDAFLEIIYNRKGEITNLKEVDPKTIDVEIDDYGIVQGYKQRVGFSDDDAIKLDKERICHIKLFSNPEHPYGISLIQPNEGAIIRMLRSDVGISNAIQRHGTTKTVFTVGSKEDGQIPPPEVLDAIEAEVEEIDEKNEFIVPWNVKVDTIDNTGIQGVDKYYNYFQTKVIIGMLCPEEALGLGTGSTEATAKVKAILFERIIRSFQMRLANIIEDQIFDVILEKNGFDPDLVSLSFASVTDEDEAMKAKWLGNLMRGFTHTKYRPFTINEIRKVMKFRPLDVPEADTIDYGIDGIDSEPEDEEEKPDADTEEEPTEEEEVSEEEEKDEKE
jgi:hypothetical protein